MLWDYPYPRYWRRLHLDREEVGPDERRSAIVLKTVHHLRTYSEIRPQHNLAVAVGVDDPPSPAILSNNNIVPQDVIDHEFFVLFLLRVLFLAGQMRDRQDGLSEL